MGKFNSNPPHQIPKTIKSMTDDLTPAEENTLYKTDIKATFVAILFLIIQCNPGEGKIPKSLNQY